MWFRLDHTRLGFLLPQRYPEGRFDEKEPNRPVRSEREAARSFALICSAYEIGEVGAMIMEQAKKGLEKKKTVVATYRLADQKAASDALSKVRNMAKNT